MKVSEILNIKGNTLYTASPDDFLYEAITKMVELDIGSLVVLEKGKLVGMLTFREILGAIHRNGGKVADQKVDVAYARKPLVLSPEMNVFEMRQQMLDTHTRYVPVMDGELLMGVLSLFDVAKSMIQAQKLENEMLKAYIRDWPEEDPKNDHSV